MALQKQQPMNEAKGTTAKHEADSLYKRLACMQWVNSLNNLAKATCNKQQTNAKRIIHNCLCSNKKRFWRYLKANYKHKGLSHWRHNIES
ncbi:unnamed protein product [Ceratitis capitata]|uniref:(Mediterranean fruit fly) hypothetical protein n=1 Tax=Ceratitis capitata TaxID=7213 RepID=A0A811UUY2_CERCA|nr:unnamed protein product [Ceratitis capitata]